MSKCSLPRLAGFTLALLCLAPAVASAAPSSSLKAAANGNYVTAENAGADFLVANRTAVGTWEQFEVVENADGTVSFRAAINGRYVSADLNSGAKLIADRTTIDAWEKFRRVSQANGTVALQAVANGLYVSADLNQGGVLVADRAAAQGWEQFVIAPLGSSPPPSGDAPTAADLLALTTQGCSEVTSGLYSTDWGQAATIPICGLDGAVFWKGDMDIDCDGKETGVCNGSTDPSYWHETSATDSHGEFLDASTLPYVVVPLPSWRFDYAKAGIQLGTVVAVIHGDRVVYGVFGDEGPQDIIGEASYAMAVALGIDPDPATGGVGSGVTYIAFTGSSGVVSPIEDHSLATQLGQARARALLQR